MPPRPRVADEVNRFRADYATKLQSSTMRSTRRQRGSRFWSRRSTTTTRFTYIRSAAREKPALYEIKDGKPNLISFQLENGVVHRPEDHRRGLPRRRQKEIDVRAARRRELRKRAMVETPQVQDKAPKPAGLLPKNVQSWLLVGPCVSDGRDHVADGRQETAAPHGPRRSAAPVAPPLEVNETKIAELQNRIEELQRAAAGRAERSGATDSLARRPARFTASATIRRRASFGRSSRMKIRFRPNARGVPMCPCLPRMSR